MAGNHLLLHLTYLWQMSDHMQRRRKILVLYRELAAYFLACLNDYCERFGVHADVIAYPVNPDAPFRFSFSERLRLFDRFALKEEEIGNMAGSGEYDLVFCGGWADKGYMKAVRKRKNAVALLAFDNQWQGSLKQRLATVYAKVFLTPYFDFAFVPGVEQKSFAHRMGFKEVALGVYSCDYEVFNSIFENRKTRVSQGKNRLLYVGRYAPEKYFQELCDVFVELFEEGFSNWELHAAGTGPLFDQRLQHSAIHHHGFLQPGALRELMCSGEAFVLPSIFEPWGVVVHEFAAAGYPMVLSDRVGARTAFLEDGGNGYLFTSGSRPALKASLRKLFSCNKTQLTNMGAQSHLLASRITPQIWSQTLEQELHKKRK